MGIHLIKLGSPLSPDILKTHQIHKSFYRDFLRQFETYKTDGFLRSKPNIPNLQTVHTESKKPNMPTIIYCLKQNILLWESEITNAVIFLGLKPNLRSIPKNAQFLMFRNDNFCTSVINQSNYSFRTFVTCTWTCLNPYFVLLKNVIRHNWTYTEIKQPCTEFVLSLTCFGFLQWYALLKKCRVLVRNLEETRQLCYQFLASFWLIFNNA